MTLYFDMDGTLVDLYGTTNWLKDILAYNTRPFEIAKPLINPTTFSKKLLSLKNKGYKLGIISWLSKVPNPAYDKAVVNAKLKWLRTYLKDINFDEIHIIPYGTPKSQFADTTVDILFDDEAPNRKDWGNNAYDVDNILNILDMLGKN